MVVVPTYEARYAYFPGGEPVDRQDSCDTSISPAFKAGGRKACWFWAKTPMAKQHVAVIFDAAVEVRKVLLHFGHQAHKKDVLYRGALELARASGAGAGLLACGGFAKLVDITHGDSVVQWAGEPQAARCLRISVVQGQREWLILQRIYVN
uniref:Uncharacterized protein n=1 Tax=Zooxanthella nutricula TaxID=1333877 RepID=A0A7S2Q9C2_9DINO